MLNKTHYICTGCGALMPKEGTCVNTSCPNKSHALKACACKDGNHFGDLASIKKPGAKKKTDEDDILAKYDKEIFEENL